MIERFRQLFRPAPARPRAAIPPGERVYAVGDIHGRRDLFAVLAAAIDADDAARGPADTTVILLGDLVDRGPDSAGVIDAAREWAGRRRVRTIAGNHEEMFLASFTKPLALRQFLRVGGHETVLSYPLDPEAFRTAELEEAQAMLLDAVPLAHREFLQQLEDMIGIGDYLFVHAGIRPGIAAGDQLASDLRWIREPFLGHSGEHGCIVVHGHTITEDIAVRPNRIGIDTGAYMTGKLTALALEGADRWLLQTRNGADGLAVSELPA